MKKTILTFGLISGAIMAALMLATIPFEHKIGFNKGLIVGYTTMVISFLLVFFGVRSYRENVGGGYISFGRAFTVGILIALITCACYVITWEFVYFFIMPDFWDKYSAFMVENLKASGASAQAIEAKVQEMKNFKVLYDNPLINSAMTFIEPFPVGLVFTLISALILRKKPREVVSQTP